MILFLHLRSKMQTSAIFMVCGIQTATLHQASSYHYTEYTGVYSENFTEYQSLIFILPNNDKKYRE